MADQHSGNITYAQVRLLLLSHYEKGQYQAGLDALDLHINRFPDQDVNFAYWRLCLLAKLGETGEAMRALQSFLSKGYWWSAESLKSDEDLANLQTDPEFLKILDVCETRQLEAQRISQPKRFTLLPEALLPKDAAPLLLFLHGRNGNSTSYIEYWQEATRAGWIVALLASSQVIGYDTYCWDDKALAEKEIQQHFRELNNQYSIDPDRIVLAGFSQGGGVAVRAAITHIIPAAGFLVVAPTLAPSDNLEIRSGAGVRVRGAVLAGEQDIRWVETARKIGNKMTAAGLPCETHIYPDLGHDFPPDFSTRLTAFLKTI